MCGIFGFGFVANVDASRSGMGRLLKRLFLFSETRGREAAGVAFSTPDHLSLYKDSQVASKMIKTSEYRNVMKKAFDEVFNDTFNLSAPFAAIGHSRLVTNGVQAIYANNQPVVHRSIVLIHNGIIVNVPEICKHLGSDRRESDVDSEILAVLLFDKLENGIEPVAATVEMFNTIEGEASIACFCNDRDLMILGTNTGSLYIAENSEQTGFFFASERYIVDKVLADPQVSKMMPGASVQQLSAGSGRVYRQKTLEVIEFSFQHDPLPAFTPCRLKNTNRRLIDKMDHLHEKRRRMRRCTRCILPETMPFISFDSEGVCNYCNNYQKQQLKSTEELMRIFNKHRHNGSPDCLVAFSGGRDSSYGLHILRETFGMNPVAFTYDWGMVTDLARRNQARICGKLGIEHIWLSADIQAKRRNIRRNVNAWLRRPRLGMVPLFMAGDKQFFYYGNRIMENMNIKLVVWCMNNLERTDFKIGFAGLPPRWDRSRRHYQLSLFRTGKIGFYYLSQILSNPAYLNRSIFDSIFAFASYYLVAQDHVYLFDYIPWEESEVSETLIREYNWETAEDTRTTWRIGDGTAGFYNFIYYTVAGFTEHDTFRSNQIREGQMDREIALKLVAEENQPRWASIREYCRLIGLDFENVVQVIDNVPKLYDRSC